MVGGHSLCWRKRRQGGRQNTRWRRRKPGSQMALTSSNAPHQRQRTSYYRCSIGNKKKSEGSGSW
nr:coronin 2A [Rousettus aegyptiacus]